MHCAMRNTYPISTCRKPSTRYRNWEYPRAWFTHISHQLGKHADVNPTLPSGMELGYDGLIINV